jgi:hypothetical protein
VAVRSASGAASERATNEPGHAVTRWMITLARLDQSARALGDPSAALPVATAFLGPEQFQSLACPSPGAGTSKFNV